MREVLGTSPLGHTGILPGWDPTQGDGMAEEEGEVHLGNSDEIAEISAKNYRRLCEYAEHSTGCRAGLLVGEQDVKFGDDELKGEEHDWDITPIMLHEDGGFYAIDLPFAFGVGGGQGTVLKGDGMLPRPVLKSRQHMIYWRGEDGAVVRELSYKNERAAFNGGKKSRSAWDPTNNGFVSIPMGEGMLSPKYWSKEFLRLQGWGKDVILRKKGGVTASPEIHPNNPVPQLAKERTPVDTFEEDSNNIWNYCE